MRLKRSDTVGHVDLNRSLRRSSFSHEERILRRNLPPASFCENFVLAIFRLFQQNRPEAGNAHRQVVHWTRFQLEFEGVGHETDSSRMCLHWSGLIRTGAELFFA